MPIDKSFRHAHLTISPVYFFCELLHNWPKWRANACFPPLRSNSSLNMVKHYTNPLIYLLYLDMECSLAFSYCRRISEYRKTTNWLNNIYNLMHNKFHNFWIRGFSRLKRIFNKLHKETIFLDKRILTHLCFTNIIV